MKLYSTHFAVPDPADPARPERPPVLVQDGFSWWGLVFGWLVLLRPGGWLVATLAATATVMIKLGSLYLPAAWALLPGLHLAVGLFANDWRRWELRQSGFVDGPLTAGQDHDAALLRLFDQHPDVVTARPAGAA